MKLLLKVFLVTWTVCCLAAPNTLGPVNPSVFGDSKPADKITLITDARELAQYRRETRHPLYPTVLPEIEHHHVTKLDNNEGLESKPVTNSKEPEHLTKPTPPQSSQKTQLNIVPKKLAVETSRTSAVPYNDGHAEAFALHKPQSLPATTLTKSLNYPAVQHKRDIPVPLVAKKKHPEVSVSTSSEDDSKMESDKRKKDQHEEHKPSESTHENHAEINNFQAEDLSMTKPLGEQVPSLPKQLQIHLQDGHTKNEHTTSEDQHTLLDSHHNSHDSTSTTNHPLIRPRPVPVAELFARHHDN